MAFEIEDNEFGTAGGNANNVGLNVFASGSSVVNLNVINNAIFSDDESVRIQALFIPAVTTNTVDLNLFDNQTNDDYELIRNAIPFVGGSTFALGFDPGQNEMDVADQIDTNGNTTNGGNPSTDITGENVFFGGDYDFIMRNSIDLPPVFP